MSRPAPFRVGVLVSGAGTNLQAILDRLHGRRGIRVVCVGSNRAQAAGLDRARAAAVETEVFAAVDHPDRLHRDRALGDWLESHGVDLVVLAGFMEVLSGEFVGRFAGRLLNVHPSLLPAFPGVRAIEQAIDYGVRITGVTVHFVDEGVDTGPIILQRAIDLPYPRDIQWVRQQIQGVEHELLPEAIGLIAAGAVRIDPDHPRQVLVEKATVGHR